MHRLLLLCTHTHTPILLDTWFVHSTSLEQCITFFIVSCTQFTQSVCCTASVGYFTRANIFHWPLMCHSYLSQNNAIDINLSLSLSLSLCACHLWHHLLPRVLLRWIFPSLCLVHLAFILVQTTQWHECEGHLHVHLVYLFYLLLSCSYSSHAISLNDSHTLDTQVTQLI